MLTPELYVYSTDKPTFDSPPSDTVPYRFSQTPMNKPLNMMLSSTSHNAGCLKSRPTWLEIEVTTACYPVGVMFTPVLSEKSTVVDEDPALL